MKKQEKFFIVQFPVLGFRRKMGTVGMPKRLPLTCSIDFAMVKKKGEGAILSEQQGLEQIRSLDKIDVSLTIVGVRGWFVLAFFLALMTGVIIWSFLGSIPVEVTGKAILFEPGSVTEIVSDKRGLIADILVKAGDLVKEGDPLLILADGEAIQAPAEGTIAWVGVIENEQLTPTSVIGWIQRAYNPEKLEIYAFIPLFSGEQVKVGMQAKTELDIAPADKFGAILGKVEEVQPYPVSLSDRRLQQIPSESLRQYLVQGTLPNILVTIKPALDPDSPSGLKWTHGFPETIRPGATGNIRILLEKKKPISYVCPALSSFVNFGAHLLGPSAVLAFPNFPSWLQVSAMLLEPKIYGQNSQNLTERGIFPGWN